jgi:hypothetical protein
LALRLESRKTGARFEGQQVGDQSARFAAFSRFGSSFDVDRHVERTDSKLLFGSDTLIHQHQHTV